MGEPAHLTADQARAALAGADAARRGLAARGRWLVAYFSAFAVGSVAVVLLIGLGGSGGMVFAMAGWALLVSVAVAWAGTRPVRLRSEGRLHAGAPGGWAVVYGAVLVASDGARGDAGYWVPAAVVSALPLLAVAVLAHRRAQR